MLESARILLEIFAARLENCSKYLLLGSARLDSARLGSARILFETKLLENARLGFQIPCSKSPNNNVKYSAHLRINC